MVFSKDNLLEKESQDCCLCDEHPYAKETWMEFKNFKNLKKKTLRSFLHTHTQRVVRRVKSIKNSKKNNNNKKLYRSQYIYIYIHPINYDE